MFPHDRSFRNSSAWALALLGLMSAPLYGQIQYDFVLVDSFNANPLAGEAYLWGINDLGVACGQATVDNVIGYPGMVWSEDSGRVRVPVASPAAVNDSGLIVGIGDLYDLTTDQTFSPPNLPGTYYAPQFGDVNNLGIAVGSISICSCSDSGGVLRIPYIWDAASGARTVAVPNAKGLSRINSAGVAIGWLNGWTLNDGFFVDLNSGAYTYLADVFPDVGTGPIRAADINDSGMIAGSRAGYYPVYRYGYVYSPDNGVEMLPFPGAGYQQYVAPTSINNAGTVVGTLSTTTASQRVFVYTRADGLRDLNDGALIAGMPAGYRLYMPTAINNHGWIVGYGFTAGGKITGFVLKARPARPGDVDGDGDVDLIDLALLLSSFGACVGEGGFIAAGDFDDSGCIELSDLASLLANFGV